MALGRPRQMSMVPTDLCRHDSTEEVRSEGGDLLGEQCSVCLELLFAVATCEGCRVTKPIRFLVGAHTNRPRRFCTEDCYRNQAAEKRKAEKEKAKAEAEAERAKRGGR